MGLLKVAALWKKEGKNHLTGPIREEVVLPAGGRLFIFPNKDKQNENAPDFEVCLQVEDDQEQPRQGGKFAGNGQGGGQRQQGNGGNGQRQNQGGGGYNRNQGGNGGGQRQNQGNGNRQPRQQEEEVNPDDFDF